jgi:phosphoribosylglycinamide formyltransferase-1
MSGNTRIGVLASGGGSNMQAIMDGIDAGAIDGRIVLVVSDNPEAYALQRAAHAGIATAVLPYKDFPSRNAFTQAITARLQAAEVDLVVHAGFMRMVTHEIVDAYYGRMMNIHPALLPSFGGAGYYGHHVHEAVLAYGAKISGCTVHFVTEEVDGGPIIVQRCVPVLEDDTPDSLAARVLQEEHRAFPEAVALYCAGRLRLDGRCVRVLAPVAL